VTVADMDGSRSDISERAADSEYSMLALAVIAQAVRDVCAAGLPGDTARFFFSRTNRPTLMFWCAVAGIDSESVVFAVQRQTEGENCRSTVRFGTSGRRARDASGLR
jgi:hypothetical protein